jgi:hypothetical protein
VSLFDAPPRSVTLRSVYGVTVYLPDAIEDADGWTGTPERGRPALRYPRRTWAPTATSIPGPVAPAASAHPPSA